MDTKAYTGVALIVLAAGRGSRLKADRPKPLVEIGGEPLIQTVLTLSEQLPFVQTIVCVSEVTSEIVQHFPHSSAQFEMAPLAGTGGTLLHVLPNLRPEVGTVVICQADDSHFYTEQVFGELLQRHQFAGADFTLGVAKLTEQARYAWVDWDEHSGLLTAIHKQPDELDAPPPKDIACGLYTAKRAWLEQWLPHVPVATNGELPLPGVLEVAPSDSVVAVQRVPVGTWMGVNTPEELEQARAVKRQRQV